MLLITDRQASDLSVYNDKGNYNASDFNRVNEACIELVSLMKSVGASGSGDFKTDWTMYDYPTKAKTDYYLKQIYGIINAYYKRNEYDLPEDMSAFDYGQANIIEKALLDIKEVIENTKAAYIDTGMYYSGYSVDGLRGYTL